MLVKKLVYFFLALICTMNSWANLEPCGLRGTLEERISDCKNQESPLGFRLVTYTEDGQSFYQDSKTSLVWSPVLRKSPKNRRKRTIKSFCPKPYRLPSHFELTTLLKNQYLAWNPEAFNGVDYIFISFPLKRPGITRSNSHRNMHFIYSLKKKRYVNLRRLKDNSAALCVGDLKNYTLLEIPQ